MKTLIMLCGIPGSGKSTWAKAYQKEHQNTHIVDTDEVRKSVTGSYQIFPPDRRVLYDKMIEEGNAFLREAPAGATLIEDSTFTDNYRRLYYMERLKGYDHAILLLTRMHDYSLCFARNKKRKKEKWVPDEAIQNFIDHYEEPSPEVRARFDEIKTLYLD